jgi:hypothetical protein
MKTEYIEILRKYRDANKTSSPNDEFNKLFSQFSDGKGIKNMGGFRIRKSDVNNSVAFALLITNSSEPEWPDSLDIGKSVFLYYGDKRGPYGVNDELHDTQPQGNILLRDTFFHLDREQRDEIPPFLIFKKEKTSEGVYMHFLGLAAPGVQGEAPLSGLRAVWHRNKNDEFCLNYEALFSILDVDKVPMNWLEDIIQTGEITTSSHCPEVWSNWVASGEYNRLSYENLLIR